jgi:hypothetical protein
LIFDDQMPPEVKATTPPVQTVYHALAYYPYNQTAAANEAFGMGLSGPGLWTRRSHPATGSMTTSSWRWRWPAGSGRTVSGAWRFYGSGRSFRLADHHSTLSLA